MTSTPRQSEKPPLVQELSRPLDAMNTGDKLLALSRDIYATIARSGLEVSDGQRAIEIVKRMLDSLEARHG